MWKKGLYKKLGILTMICALVFTSFVRSVSASLTFITQFGSSGYGSGQFTSPHSVAIDSAGYIYVMDGNFIQQFDSSRNFTNQFGSYGSGDGQFGSSGGIAVDSSGNIYITDADNYRVQKFDATGAYLSQFGTQGSGDGQFSIPRGIAVGSYIYVVDQNNHRVQIFDLSGSYVSQFGSYGSGNGEFDSPQGIAIDYMGNVYVVDSSNNRIQMFDASGNYVSQFGSLGSDDGQFSNPSYIAIDNSTNYIYVTDWNNSRIQKLDLSGNFISKSGSYGVGYGQFDNPSGIAVDSSGNVYVVDTNNSRVQVFGPDTVPPEATGAIASDNTVVIDFNEDIYSGGSVSTMGFAVSDFFGTAYPDSVSVSTNQVTLTFPDNTFQRGDSLTVSYSGSDVMDNEFNQAVSFSLSVDNQIPELAIDNFSYTVSDDQTQVTFNITTSLPTEVVIGYGTISNNEQSQSDLSLQTSHTLTLTGLSPNTIYTYYINIYNTAANQNVTIGSTSGEKTFITNYVSKFGTYGSGDNGELAVPKSIATDAAGNIYVADYGNNRVQKYNPLGSYVLGFGSYGSGNGEFNGPSGVVVDSSGDLYVTDSGNNRVQKFDQLGNYISQFGSSGSGVGEFNNPTDIAIDASQNLYVLESAGRVQKFDQLGNYISQFGSSGSDNGQFSNPGGLTVDSSGSIYVADTGNHRVQKFDSSGAYVFQFGSTGTGDGGFNYPQDVAVDSSGNIYVTDQDNNRVQKFDSSGYYVSQFGTPGNQSAQLSAPKGLMIDSLDDIYVADTGNYRVQKFGDLRAPDTTAPSITSLASSTTGTTATITWTTDELATSTVRYGLTSGYGTASSSAIATTSHRFVLTGLTPGTTYHFEASSADALGNSNTSVDSVFTTTDTVPPTISSIATSTTQTTATITWTTNEAATSTVNYGVTTGYGTASSSAIATTTHRTVLTGLTPDTTYHFRISSWDGSGNIATSSDVVFRTLDATTLSPTLSAPIAGTYTNTTPMSVSFILPEPALSGSISLTFTPAVGSPIVLQLRDALDSQVNTFTLPLVSGITTTVTEVLSATSDSIPVGTYTVSLSYRDALGNPASTASVTDVVVQEPVVTPPTPTPSSAPSVSSGSFQGPTGGSSSGGYSYVTQNQTPTISTSTTPTPTYKPIFTKNLSLNMIDVQVRELQKFLNAKGYLVAKIGAGSPGKETMKFGPATRAALIRFQKAQNITPAIGFFGPVTRSIVRDMK